MFLLLSAYAEAASNVDDTKLYKIDIPELNAAEALNLFAEQTDIVLLFPYEEASQHRANKVRGQFTLGQGLDALLKGSGLQGNLSTNGTVTISLATQNQNVEGRKKVPKKNRLTLGILTAISSFFVVSTSAEEANSEDTVVDEEIVAVGSHIRGAKTTGALPVTSLGKADLDSIGSVTTDELIAALPQAGGQNFNGESQGPNSARGDVASANLRSLGSGNTLVLLNGRRMVLHPTTQNENIGVGSVPVQIVNINAIPGSAIERIEVLRDGAGATYGADATAGVLNHVIDGDYEGLQLGVRYGQSQGTSLDETSFDFKWGTSFNDGATNLTIAGGYFDRSALRATERSYYSSSDRSNLVPPELAGSFNNLSSDSPWLQFDTPDDVTIGGVTDDRFHVRPCNNADVIAASGADVADLGDGICLGAGSLPRTVLGDDDAPNVDLVPESDRISVFVSLSHELESGTEFFGELNYYDSNSFATRGGSGVLSSAPIAIGADNPFNPLGSGAGRLAGLGADVPAEGLRLTTSNFRTFEAGNRTIDVNSEVFRVLGGFKGQFENWDWEFAGLYSEADTIDIEGNRTSSTALQNALNSADAATAFNAFNGGDINNPNVGDTTLNSNLADALRIDVTRDSSSSLALWDFKLSTPEFFNLRGEPVGAAFGAEWRREEVSDNRDDRVDGTIGFTTASGGITSDVVNTSPTSDFDGSRQVFSVFGELQAPLITENDAIPLVQSVDVQLAARYESFSDIEDEILVPKLGLSWRVNDWLMFRGAYTEGFRAPNIEQLQREQVSRVSQNVVDFHACVAEGAAPSLDAALATPALCAAVLTNPETITGGNLNLDPEDGESVTYGFVLQPWDGMTFTTDFWRIEQTGIVGTGASLADQLLFDALERSEGRAGNPAVTRGSDGRASVVSTQFQNTDTRVVRGVDLSVQQDFDTDIGTIRLKTDWSLLKTLSFQPGPLSQALLDAGLPTSGGGSLIRNRDNPYSRGSASVQWVGDQWGASVFGRYVGRVLDTNGGLGGLPEGGFDGGDFVQVNTSVNYRFEGGALDQSVVKVGVNNVFDEEPPLADEITGYFRALYSNRGRYFFVSFSKEFN
ncbi:TonB-dependent receptor [bacterium SCSIO 12696]|nr:TonB-dependent receptor [bacterium SCSIO 12696]